MTSSVHQAREALGQRLRELRKNAGLSGTRLAKHAGWNNSSKVSKIEHGKQTPSEDDIRTWCRHTHTQDQIPDLIATVRDIEAMYVEWRKMLEVGTRRRQRRSRALEAETKLMRWYEPLLVPGILHTAEYTTAVLSRVIDFYKIPNDLNAGVSERMERQHILYSGDHRFHFIVAQQALRTMVGSTETMIGQLDRLLAVISLARVKFGIIPAHTEYTVPTNQFIMFDNRLVNVETISSELAITQPREIALYTEAFNELAKQAAYGPAARKLISKEIADLVSRQAKMDTAANGPA